MLSTNVAPGLVQGMSNDAYHATDGTSKTMLDDIAPECGNSPRDFWAAHVDPNRERSEPSPQMIIGTAIHAAVLEPDSFMDGFLTVPEDAPKRPSSAQRKAAKPSPDTINAIAWWDEFSAGAAGKVILDADDRQRVIGARDAVLTHPDVKGLFTRGAAEESFFAIDPETGELIKCRPDFHRLAYDGLVIDLKSTADASEEGFGRAATTFRYDVADPWYCDVVNLALEGPYARNFAFVAVEPDPPHNVGLYYLKAEDRLRGRTMGRRDLRRIKRCREENYWPDWAGERGPRPIQIRPFARRDIAA